MAVMVMSRARRILGLAIVLGCGLTVPSLGSTPADNQAASVSPAQLIREVVDAEVKATDADHSHWMYRQHHVDPNKDIVQECVQTKDGDICRHLAEGGHTLNSAEQQQEQKRIHNLLDNPEQERKADRKSVV